MRSWCGLAFSGTFPTVSDPLLFQAPYTPGLGSPQIWFSRPEQQIICDVLNQWFNFYVITARYRPDLQPNDPLFRQNTHPYVPDNPSIFTPPRGDLAILNYDARLFGPLNMQLGSYFHEHDTN